MPTPDAPEIPKQDPQLSGHVIETPEPPIDDDERRRRSSAALALIRSRRRKLPPGAPDSVAMLRKMRGYDD